MSNAAWFRALTSGHPPCPLCQDTRWEWQYACEACMARALLGICSVVDEALPTSETCVRCGRRCPAWAAVCETCHGSVVDETREAGT